MARNRDWSFNELALALALYLDERRVLDEKDPRVIELAQQLTDLAGSGNPEEAVVRTPAAIVMKLANFRALDPLSPSAGLDAGGKLDKRVWEELAESPDALDAVATTIRSPLRATSDYSESAEGRTVLRRHLVRERDLTLRARKLAEQRRDHGALRCGACGLEPETLYGERGEAVIECHHREPLSEGPRVTRLSDVDVVCANCHRAIHAQLPWIALAELRDSLGRNAAI